MPIEHPLLYYTLPPRGNESISQTLPSLCIEIESVGLWGLQTSKGSHTPNNHFPPFEYFPLWFKQSCCKGVIKHGIQMGIKDAFSHPSEEHQVPLKSIAKLCFSDWNNSALDSDAPFASTGKEVTTTKTSKGTYLFHMTYGNPSLWPVYSAKTEAENMDQRITEGSCSITYPILCWSF